MKLLKNILRNEGGQALPMALILLVLGGLIIVPMLHFMTTNLNTNRVIETKTAGIYGADAGIQDALWKLGDGVDPFASGDSYDLSENVNGMTVTVEKQALSSVEDGDLYTVKSTARLNGEPKAVIIAQAVSGYDFSWLFQHAITSAGDINISPGNVIYGDVICGGDFNGDEDDVNGDIYDNATVKLPSEELLTAYYLGKFDDTVCSDPVNYCPDEPYSSSIYSVSGGTELYPEMLPWLYCSGNLEIGGSGYAKLNGNIFVNGQFKLVNKDIILDLNGYTIYATYYTGTCPTSPNDSNCAVYFGSGTQLRGPGCVIGVGAINFQPALGQGKFLLGPTVGSAKQEEVDPAYKTIETKNRFVFSKFTTTNDKIYDSDSLLSIQVLCDISGVETPPAHLKVAIYDDNNGVPGNLISSSASENVTLSTWTPISLPAGVNLSKKTPYWLAAIADANIIVADSTPGWTDSRYINSNFINAFPDPAGQYGSLTETTNKYMLRGLTSGQDFIFLMSVKCTTYLAPDANFYGSVVGNTSVNLQPGCFINLVGVPEEGLDFPSITAGLSGSGTEGNSPPILMYRIE
jgi:hypothetical protein